MKKKARPQMHSSKLQNTFKSDRDEHLIDFRNKNIWMHSVERTDTNNAGETITSFAIFICFIALVIAILCAIAEYPKAYPGNQSTNSKTLNK